MGHGGYAGRATIARSVLLASWFLALCPTNRAICDEPAPPTPKPAAEQAAGSGEKSADSKTPPKAESPKPNEAPKPRVRALPLQIQMRGMAVPGLRRGNVIINGEVRGENGDVDPVFFPADRATMQRLSKARDLLEQKRYGESVRLLGEILEGPEDFFFQPKRDEPIHRSLKSEAQRLIGELPAEGRESYELQYGAAAQKKLDEAIASGDAAALAEVSRRFFHTQAGYEATHLLGTYQLDHGRPLAAALCFKRLQATPAAAKFEPLLSVKMATCWARAGMPDKAEEALRSLDPKYRTQKVVLRGRETPLFGRDEEAAGWLARAVGTQAAQAVTGSDQWTMYRGSPGRNTISAGSSPLLNRRWGVPTSDENGAIEGMVKQLRQVSLDQNAGLLPSLHPLAVNDYVFMRSVGGLVAINFTTGKRVWRGPIDESVRQLLEPDAQYGSVSRPSQIGNARVVPRSAMSLVPGWLSQRIWDDATYGTMSSDGERVFCVEDLDVGFGVFDQRQVVLPNGRRTLQAPGPRSYNRLAAYDVATEGKLKWEAGGPPGESQSELAGSFFLGPPLPLAGWVYALAEIKGEVRLVALDATTGKVEWTQQLAVLEQNIATDTLRRTAGVSPSYSDGVLVCPTSAGAVVAVDLTTRSLLWGYQYARADGGPQEMIRLRVAGVPVVGNNAAGNNRWADGSVTIAEGCVLLTPLESNQLHCLNLLDGKLLWQKPREDGLYLGCVHQGKAVVVGRGSVRALKLSDGSPAWSEAGVTLPGGSTPSGRGFFNGKRYHLPLTTAEVAAIDVDAGRLVARSKSRNGTIPGNLICYRGAVISQGVEVIERFDQRDDLWRQIAAKIAASPDDAAALARRGELLLDEGNFNEAIVNLRRSFQLQNDPRTRELLVDALLEGLRIDFAGHRAQLDEIERLLTEPQQRGTFLRLVAAGLQSAGEVSAAFAAYLRIAELPSDGGQLERVDHSLSVRRDRWVQARLKELIGAASPQQRVEMQQAIAGRLAAAQKQSGPAALRSFLDYFGSLPSADEARELLAARLIESGALLEAEQLLARLEQSGDARRAAAATARIAALVESAGRHDDAAIYYRRLGDSLADVPCLEGKTGRQIVAALPEKSELRRLLAPAPAWPVGEVERDEQKGQGGNNNRNFALDLCGPLGPFFAYASVELDHQQQALVGKDEFGRERWRVALREPNQNNTFFFNPQMNHARVSGHLLLVSMGYQLLAIDVLGGGDNEGAKVLWRQDLMEGMPGVGNVGFQAHVVQVPWAAPRLVAADPLGRPLGNVGPVTPDIACYQRSRSVIAVRPLTGETLWNRSDAQPGSDIFGDDEMLFIVAPGAAEALVVRTLDGLELGRRKIPPTGQRMVTLGRRVVSWVTDGGRSTLKLTDVWQQKDIWQRPFDANVKAWTVGEEAVGVMTPEGQFQLVSLADGKLLIDAKVKPEPQLSEVYVLRSPDQYIVLANHPWQARNGVNHQPVPGSNGNPLVCGHVHLFDRHTGQLIRSTRVDKQGLLLSQPSGLPALTFATHIYDQKNRSRNVETAVMFLDKRSGRIVHEERLATPLAAVDVSADPERNQMLLKTPGASLRLTFTGNPHKSEPPADDESQAASETDTQRAGRAVLRGLQKWLGNLTPAPVEAAAPQPGLPRPGAEKPPAPGEKKSSDEPQPAEPVRPPEDVPNTKEEGVDPFEP